MSRYGLGRVFSFPFDFRKSTDSIRGTRRGEICIAQGLPRESELVRLGNSFISPSITVSSINSLPPIQSGWILNGESQSGKFYIISTIIVERTSSIGSAGIMGLAVQLNTQNPISPPSIPSTAAILSLSGRSTKKSKAIFSDALFSGTPPDDNAWHRTGQALVIANTSNATVSIEYSVYGRYIVPPQGAFAYTCLDSIGSTPVIRIIWHEVQL